MKVKKNFFFFTLKINICANIQRTFSLQFKAKKLKYLSTKNSKNIFLTLLGQKIS